MTTAAWIKKNEFISRLRRPRAVFKKKTFFIYTLVCVFLTINAPFLFAKGSADKETPEYTAPEIQTPLAAPVDKAGKQEKQALEALEIASPQSLRRAADILLAQRSAGELTGMDKSLYAAACEIMRAAYPLERWEYPTIKTDSADVYGAIIDSARSGVYDYNGAGTDYLSMMLPSLVLFFSPRDDYYDDAEEALRQCAAENKDAALAPYLLGLLYERRARYAEAESAYKKAWNADSSCYPAGEGIVRMSIKTGKAQEGTSVAMELYNRYPTAQEIICLCGEVYFYAGDWNAAETFVTAALRNDPGNSAFLLMRARILVEQKEYVKAGSLLDAYAQVDPYALSYLLLRARVQREWNKNNTAAALTAAEAVARYPDNIYALLAAAEIAAQGGVTVANQNAGYYIDAALALEPDNVAALTLRASVCAKNRDWQSVAQIGSRLLSSVDTIEIRVQTARAYLELSQVSPALEIIAPAYETAPSDESVVDIYLRALVASKRNTEAEYIISERLDQSSPTLKSVLYYHRSQLSHTEESVLSNLRSSLLSNPRNQDALMAMYSYYFNKKDYKKAMYYLKQSIALNPGDRYLLQLQAQLEALGA